MFSRDNRPLIRAQLLAGLEARGTPVVPSQLQADTMKELSARWRRTTPDERALFAAKAISQLQDGSSAADAADDGADEPEPDAFYLPSIDTQRRDNAERRRMQPIASAAAVGAPSARQVVELSSDDDDRPIQRASGSGAAAAAPTAVSKNATVASPVALPAVPAHPHANKLSNPAFEGLLEEYTCGICADIIYQCVVLGQLLASGRAGDARFSIFC